MTTEPTDVLEEQKAIFEAKNADYSDTWIVSGVALAALHDEPVTLETDVDHIVNGNVHRLLDKILRGYSATIIQDDVNFEAAVDSFRDAATYAAMIASVLEGEPTARLNVAYDNALGLAPDAREDERTLGGDGIATGDASEDEDVEVGETENATEDESEATVFVSAQERVPREQTPSGFGGNTEESQ